MMKSKIKNDLLLKKCSDLFERENNNWSKQSRIYWKKMRNLIMKNDKNSDWEDAIYSKLLNNRLVTTSGNNFNDILEKSILQFPLNSHRIFFINGLYSSKFSDNNIGDWKIKIENKKFLKEPIFPEFFSYLNEMFIKQTVHIQLSKENVENKPLYLIHIINQLDNDKSKLHMINYRHDINIERNSKGCIVECFINFSEKRSCFTCTSSNINIENNADFQYIKFIIQNDVNHYFSNNNVFIKKNAMVNSNSLIFGNGSTKHKDNIKFISNQSKLFINNLLLSSKTGINEIHSYVEHKKNECISRQKHKILSFEESKNFFNGTIKIYNNTYKNNAKMLNNNFLIGNLSEIYTEPKLEILSEDVQCNHGATIGKINEEQVFYLCSRGISKNSAINIILFSICKEIVQMIDQIKIKNIIFTYIKQFLKEQKYELSYSKNTI